MSSADSKKRKKRAKTRTRAHGRRRLLAKRVDPLVQTWPAVQVCGENEQLAQQRRGFETDVRPQDVRQLSSILSASKQMLHSHSDDSDSAGAARAASSPSWTASVAGGSPATSCGSHSSIQGRRTSTPVLVLRSGLAGRDGGEILCAAVGRVWGRAAHGGGAPHVPVCV